VETSGTAEQFARAVQCLRDNDAAGAAALAREALAAAPDDVDLLTLLGASLNVLREPVPALESLERALQRAPQMPRALAERGLALLLLRRPAEAVATLEQALALEPVSSTVRRRLAQALLACGRGEEADRVIAEDFGASPARQLLLEAAQQQRAGRFRESEAPLRRALAMQPEDVNALRLLARVADEAGRYGEAERLLRQALVITPGFDDARLDLARVLKSRDRIDAAVECAQEVTRRSPRNPLGHYLHASLLAVAGRHAEAIAAYHESIRLRADNPAAWIGLGHLQKTLGRQREGIEAYREALRLRPGFGEVWWSLANLKTFRFSDEDVAAMERQLESPQLDEDARVHFLFALAKAREDRADYAGAFAGYAEANRRQRLRVSYDPVDTEVLHARIRATFDAQFLAARQQAPHPEQPVPIFIVGLPRSGSTLLEQILASHSLVDGTAELPDIARVIGEISRRHPEARYPQAVAQLSSAELAHLGASYLERTRRHRSGKPFFTDKMPNNFAAIGLIRLILPQARIIDARRHPLDSCLGCFKQHFALGQSFTYDLVELGEFYLEYRRMMTHWHAVLPGSVLELRYENLVREQEAETRRLLAFCGLPWEPGCLEFHRTERPVRTASSEQVREPLHARALGYWQRFRAELQPLIEVIGPAVEAEGWPL
jgi:tetratricopeptide (TPR) repeat protein